MWYESVQQATSAVPSLIAADCTPETIFFLIGVNHFSLQGLLGVRQTNCLGGDYDLSP